MTLRAGTEILLTRSSLDGSRRTFDLGEERSLELKGVAGLVGVVAIRWH